MGEGGEIEEPVDEGPGAPSVLDQEPGQDLSGGRLDIVSRPNEWDLGGSQEETPSDPADETADTETEPPASAIPDPDSDGLTVVSLPSSPVAPKQVEGASQEDRALLDRTQKWLQPAINLLAREGRHKVADDLRSQLNRQPKERPSVIVAGEDKRGKSSLVNALMKYPGLSPTGVEVVTAAPIVLNRSPEESAFVYHYGDEKKIVVSFEEARTLATVTGNPLNEQNIRSVHLGVDRPILDRFTLVDTPGVGGLESGHAALTLQSLRDADALLFVLEAGAQIRAQELAFLQTAASRINRVVFAFTKVDLHRGWQTVMATNRQILSERAPRLANCPMMAVSSQLALKALTLDGEDAEELRAESGVAELEKTLIESVAGRTAKLRAANLVQSALAPIAILDRVVASRIAAADSPQQAQAALAAERTRLNDLRQDRTGWVQQFNGGLQRIAIDRREQLTRGLIELRSKYEARLKEIKKSEHDSLPGEFVADISAMASKINEWTEGLLVELVVTIVDDVDRNARVAESIRQVSDAAFLEELARLPIGKHAVTGSQKLQLLQSYSSGHGLAALVATGGIGLSIVAAPIAIAAGVGLGGLMAFNTFRNQRQTAFVTEFRAWMNEEINRGQLAISSGYERAMIDVQDKMRDAMTGAFTAREKEINEAIEACQRSLKQAQTERQRDQQQLTGKLEEIRNIKRAGLSLLDAANS
jgi:predicted GTPase/F0F1-type ATP synthase membrane subunit b/b'